MCCEKLAILIKLWELLIKQKMYLKWMVEWMDEASLWLKTLLSYENRNFFKRKLLISIILNISQNW